MTASGAFASGDERPCRARFSALVFCLPDKAVIMTPFSFLMKGNMMPHPHFSRRSLALAALLALSLAACGDKNAEAPAAPAANSPAAAPAAPVASPPAESAAPAAPESASAPEAVASGPVVAFDIEKIPVTEKPLGAFPFFTPPEGYSYVSQGRSTLQENSTKDFNRYYFVTGKETLHALEGKTFRVQLYDDKKKEDGSRNRLDELLIERNYENAITAAGGVKVYEGEVDGMKTYHALDDTDRERYGPNYYQGRRRQTYVIRRPDAEIWVEVSCSSRCYFVVVQKGEMKQSVGLVPASAMKAALEKDGHVALYINFDVDKATIRPESEPIVAEIVKLLEENPDLNIRIEGHTDNTGEEAHNQTLSENRAAAVFGSLLARGITQSRLQSAGFGASKPIADNASEEGKARNRRVEIVKF